MEKKRQNQEDVEGINQFINVLVLRLLQNGRNILMRIHRLIFFPSPENSFISFIHVMN